MQIKEENPFVQRLKEGIDTKMLLISHNTEWINLLIYENRFENFELQPFGSISNIERHLMQTGYTLPDVDFIIYYSSNFFDEGEFAYLKRMAQKYSTDGQKRVTVGYSFCIPKKERKSKDITDAIEIYSIKDGVESEASLDAPPALYFSSLTLAGGVTEFHKIFTKDEKMLSETNSESPASLKKVYPSKND